jgi:hypothetical protein
MLVDDMFESVRTLVKMNVSMHGDVTYAVVFASGETGYKHNSCPLNSSFFPHTDLPLGKGTKMWLRMANGADIGRDATKGKQKMYWSALACL